MDGSAKDFFDALKKLKSKSKFSKKVLKDIRKVHVFRWQKKAFYRT